MGGVGKFFKDIPDTIGYAGKFLSHPGKIATPGATATPAPTAPPPPADLMTPYFRELARAATDRQIRQSQGTSGAFATPGSKSILGG